MALQRNPSSGKWKLPQGYKDLGWQVHSRNNEDVAICVKLGHNDFNSNPHWEHFDNSLYLRRCTDRITICNECKIVWHTDMSD